MAATPVAMGRDASGDYLVPIGAEKPAVFFFEAYIKNFRFAEIKEKIDRRAPEEQSRIWMAVFKAYYTDTDGDEPRSLAFSSIFESKFTITGNSALAGLVNEGDMAEGIACAVNDDGKCEENEKAEANIPLVVASVDDGSVEFRELLGEQSHGFNEADWRRYFWMAGNPGYWHDPATRRIWVTSWDDLRDRWDKLLSGSYGSGRAEVRMQMKAIYDSGRLGLEEPGGDAWRKRLGEYYRSQKLTPQVTIQNELKVEAEGEIEWCNAGTGEIIATSKLYAAEREGLWVCTAPCQGIDDNTRLRASVRLWVSGHRCCGETGDAAEIALPFGNDMQVRVESGNAAWETSDTAHIEISLYNRQNRSCRVFFVDKQGGRTQLLYENNVFSWDIPAHTPGRIVVMDESGEEVGKTDVPVLHRGATWRGIVSLSQKVEKPGLEVTQVSLKGEADGLFDVSVKENYLIFDGNLDDYANGVDYSNRSWKVLKSGDARIDLEATLNGRTVDGALAGFLEFSMTRRTAGQANFTLTWNERAEKGHGIAFKKGPAYRSGGLDTLERYLERIAPAAQKELIDRVRKLRPEWEQTLNEREDALKPVVIFTNYTKANVNIYDDGNNLLEMKKQFGFDKAEKVVKYRVRLADKNYDDSEYSNNVIEVTIPGIGVTTNYAVLPEHIGLKPAPQIIIELPDELPDNKLQGEFSVKQGMYEQTIEVSGRTAEITLCAHMGIKSLVLQLDDYENVDLRNASSGTNSLFSTDEKYFGVNYGVTKKWKIESEDLREKIIDDDDEDCKGPDKGDNDLPKWEALPKKMRELKDKMKKLKNPRMNKNSKDSVISDINDIATAQEFMDQWERIVNYYVKQGEDESNARRKAIAFVLNIENDKDKLVDDVRNIFSQYEYWDSSTSKSKNQDD